VGAGRKQSYVFTAKKKHLRREKRGEIGGGPVDLPDGGGGRRVHGVQNRVFQGPDSYKRTASSNGEEELRLDWKGNHESRWGKEGGTRRCGTKEKKHFSRGFTNSWAGCRCGVDWGKRGGGGLQEEKSPEKVKIVEVDLAQLETRGAGSEKVGNSTFTTVVTEK